MEKQQSLCGNCSDSRHAPVIVNGTFNETALPLTQTFFSNCQRPAHELKMARDAERTAQLQQQASR